MATEKRLIDANAIPWEEYYVPDPDSNAQWDYKKEKSVLKPVVDQMPTVDAVEVVRCKHCKHWHEETGWCNHHSYFVDSNGEACSPWESPDWKMLNAEDFCSYGERKYNE